MALAFEIQGEEDLGREGRKKWKIRSRFDEGEGWEGETRVQLKTGGGGGGWGRGVQGELRHLSPRCSLGKIKSDKMEL